MAHAGTTIDELGQSAKAGSGNQMGWLALITAAVILAVGIAFGATQLNTANSSGFAPVDRSYDQVEGLRGGAVLPGGAVGGPTQQQFEHAPGRGPIR